MAGSTWTWKGGSIASAKSPTWVLTDGLGNASGLPTGDDTVVIDFPGTITLMPDFGALNLRVTAEDVIIDYGYLPPNPPIGTVATATVSLSAGSSAGIVAASGPAVNAVTPRALNWIGAAAGASFGVASNWQDFTNGGGVALSPPGADDQAQFNVVNPVTITGTGSAAALLFNGGTVSFNAANITAVGQSNSSGGTVFAPLAVWLGTTNDVVNFNGGTLNASGGVFNQFSGSGTFTASGGATVTTAAIQFGNGGGTIVVTGAGTTWHEIANGAIAGLGSPFGYMSMFGGSDRLQISAGAVMTEDGNAQIGTGAGSNGTVTVSDAGIWNVGTGGISAGANGGLGALLVTNGTVTNAGALTLGSNNGSSGLVAVNGGTVSVAGPTTIGAINANGTVTIGSGGTFLANGTFDAVGNSAGSSGSLNISAGGVFKSTLAPQSTNYILSVGNNAKTSTAAAAVGNVVVSGAGALLDMGGNPLALGLNGGTGSLLIAQGGTVLSAVLDQNAANAAAAFAAGRGGIASVTVTDAGSTLKTGGFAYFGRGGAAQLSVLNGGSFAVGTDSKGASGLGIGFGNGGNTTFVGGTGDAIVSGGGVITVAGFINVGGQGADGSLNIGAGGTVTSVTGLAVGLANLINGAVVGGNGKVAISGGGVYKVTEAAQSATTAVQIGNANANVGGPTSLSTGEVTVSGVGSLLDTNGNTMEVGRQGTGSLAISKGGSVVVGALDQSLGAPLTVGRFGSGSIFISDAGSTLTSNGLVVIGRAGTGTLQIQNKGSLVALADGKGAGGVGIGAANGVGPSYQVGGSGSALVSSGGGLFTQFDLTVGRGVSGQLTLTNGGTVETGTRVLIGNTTSVAAGETIVSLGTTTIATSAVLLGGSGVVNVGTGSILKADGGGIVSPGTSAINIGVAIGSTGELNVSGSGATVTASGYRITVGGGGQGSLLVSQGGTVLSATQFAGDGAMNIGGLAGASGAVTLSDAFSRIVASGQVNVGASGNGSLLIQSGAQMQSGGSALDLTEGFVIGGSAGATGLATVTGTNSTLSNSGRFVVGDAGFGNLAITTGGSVVTVPGTAVATGAIIGNVAGSDGSSVQVTGAGARWSVGSTLIVGNAAAGGLSIANGGSVSAGLVDLGATVSGIGNLSLSGTTSVLSLGALTIGDAGLADMSILNGATVTGGSATIGALSTATGNLDVESGGQLLLSGKIIIGDKGFAQLTIGKGAAVHAAGGFIVGVNGVVTSFGGVLDPPVVSQNFGVIGGTGMLVGDVENNGTIFAKNGTYELTGNVTTGAGQSGLLLVNGSTANLMLDGAVDSGETIAFSGAGGTLTIGNLAGFNPAAINGFAAGDHLVLSGITLASQAFDSVTDKLTLTDNLNNHYTLQFADGLTAASFTGAIVPAGTVTAGQWATDIAGNFADASRWTGGAVPGATTDAVINFASRPQVLHSGGADTVKSLTNTAGSFVMSGGTLTAGTLTNASTMRWTGGALALTTNGTLANSGTLTIGANGQRLSGTNAALTNTGGIVLGGGLGTAEIDVAFVNTGSVVLNTGTLGLNGGGSSNASLLQGSAGGVLQFGTQAGGGGATFTLTGGFYAARNTVVNGSTLDVSAASGGVVFVDSLAINAGRLATGAQNATAQGAMTQTGGTIGGTATLSAAGGAFLSGGLQTGAGETALFNASGIGGAIQLDGGRSLRNNGRLDWSAGAIALGAGDGGAVTHAASLTNAASGLLYITANARLTAVGASTVTNAGLMVAQAGSGQVDIDAPLINSGNLQLPSGTLSLNGGGSSAGDHIFTDGAATLRFGATQGSATGGSFAISGGLYAAANTVVDGGTLDVSGASGAVFPSLLKLASGRLALGALSIVDQNQLTQTGGVLAGTGTLTVFGGAALTGGVQTGAGVTRLLNTSVIGSGFQVDGGRTIRNDSLMNWSSGTIDLGAGDGGALTHAATLATTASGVFYVTAAGGRIASHGAGVVSNAGVMALNAGAGRVDIDAAFLNSGVVQVQSGTLSINGGGTMTGQMFAGAQAIVQFGTVAGGGAGGAFAVSGVSYGVGRTVVNGATLDVSGASGAGFGTSLSIGAGLLQLGALNASSGVLSLSGSGVLTGSGFFFVGGNAVLSGGLQTGSGVTVLTAPTTIVGSTSVDGGRTVVNTSSLVWNGGSIGLGSGDGGVGAHAGTLNNNSGAVFEIQTDGGLSGAGTINNGGTIVKSGGLGTTTLNAAVNNGGGTIVATAGTLSLAQGATGAGTFILDGAATLDFVSGVGGGSTMQFLHAGGTLATHADGLFGATISGFGAGDVIDAAGVVFGVGNTLGFNAGTLTVGDGTHSAGFALTGTYTQSSFHLTSDNHGGTAISYS